MSDPVVLLSTGDVVGPAGGVTDNSMVLFSGTSGKLIKGNNAVVTAAGLAILDDVNAAAQKVTLGLGDVDNTSDVNKPISTATQTALNLKAPLASPLFTGDPKAPTATPGTNTTQLATTAFVQATIETKAVGIQYILIQDQKPSGTGGGTPPGNTFSARTLNTTIANTITGATLTNNQISLPAGTYRFRGACAASVAGFSKAYIYNVTDATYVAIGMGMNCTGPGNADPVTIYSSVTGRVVITSTKLFELRHFINTNNTNGFGDPVNDGKNEMYAELEIIKEA